MRTTALEPGPCYRAMLTRDARFDGRFFVGVRTTGIFCRPVCVAPTPRRENCLFFASAAAAQAAGFRPCLRCRPESAPGTPAWAGTSATVSRALRLIAGGAMDDAGVGALALRLGITERHLSRLFQSHLGVSPLAVARTRRILAAKKLLDETNLSVTEVSLAAGFGSLRRFNAVVRETWGRSPRELRRSRRRDLVAAAPGITLRLPYRPPFDWRALVGFLAGRAVPGVEVVTPESYRRAIRLGEATGVVEVRPARGEAFLEAHIAIDRPEHLLRVADRLRQVFDLDADPREIGAQLGADPVLAARLRTLPGIRVPGAWDGFELAVRAILGQQVTVRGATTLAGRLAEAYGDALPGEGGNGTRAPARLFPVPEALVGRDLTRVGLTRARAHAVSALARAVRDGELVLDTTAASPDTLAALRALPGVGEWTAQYIAMRALREPDAFLPTDLGVRRSLGSGSVRPSPGEILAMAERWRPWRAYAVMLLWQVPLAGPVAAAGGARIAVPA